MNYRSFVQSRVKPGQDILDSMTPEKCHLNHMIAGLSGEVGELTDCIKKHIFYNKPLDYENLREELGDIHFYLEAIMAIYDVNTDVLKQENIDKLSKRYKEKYSDTQASERKDKNETDS